MPDSEPIPGGPDAVWAGPADALAFFETVGMGYLAPIASLLDWRVVDIPTLCAGPPPVADEFNMVDIAQGIIPGQAGTVRDKLHNWVDRGLWANHCQYTDATPAPTIDYAPPPAGLPEGGGPLTNDPKMFLEMYQWLKWLTKEMLPRYYRESDTFTITGTGRETIDGDHEGTPWTVYACGVRFEVIDKPDYLGRSNGGDFPVYYDMGWISLDSEGFAHPPIRLAHTSQIIGPIQARVDGFYYNLPPGVEVRWMALFPDKPTSGGGG